MNDVPTVFLFYDIEIYFILYHDFFLLSDDSILSSLYRKKPSNDDFSEGAKNCPLYILNI